MNLSKGQEAFLEVVLNKSNVFLTGKAGTGKSFIVKHVIDLLKKDNKKVIALAPTGIAANNLGGQTIHSMFNINPFGVMTFKECNFLKTEKRRLLKSIDVIFIDEISMLRPDVLDAIHWTLIKNGLDGLDKKQVVFVGDLKQLPSPISDNTRSILYKDYDGEEFYHAKIYKQLNVVNIELDSILRQSDNDFIDALNLVREGVKAPYFKQFITNEPRGVILAPYNSTVEKYNRDGLAKIDSIEYVFEADVCGNVKADDFNLESVITVKHGAKIMYLANSKNNPLINGTLGEFIVNDDNYFIRVDGVDYALEKMIFSKKEYVLNKFTNQLELQELGTITQYPIRLAYALSIHKSQGLTFDEVTVDLTRPCFQKGQLYVALSRVRTPEGLTIIK